MARVKLNPALDQLRGTLGNIVFKQYGDRTVASAMPRKSSKPPSAKQLAHRARMKEAARYGVHVSETPAERAVYEARLPARRTVYQIALGDYMNRPVVHAVDVSGLGPAGGPVVVKATDDFEVVRVEVALIGRSGEVLEEGEAQLDRAGWRYVAEAPAGEVATIRARAFDRPGGAGEMEVGV